MWKSIFAVIVLVVVFAPDAAAQRQATAQAQCVSKYGQTVCGHHCVAAYGQIKCAQTPAGVCEKAAGRIACWDPPGQVGILPGAPQATCETRYGKTACGYNCVAKYGVLKCAQTPSGVCAAKYGNVTCWDPPLGAVLIGGPAAQCVDFAGQVVCGFNCTRGFGRVACAQTPTGVCRAQNGQLRCWDPQVGSAPANVPPTAQAECVSKYGKTVCGYGCVAKYGDIKCAPRPGGVCEAAYGKIVCSQ